MTKLNHVIETTATNPDYSEREFTPEEVKNGKHRSFIGGHWETHGQHQVDFLIANGLKPEHTFLDIGCGCFRAGRPLVDYLAPNHYFGIDANLGLMEAGYDFELTDEQRAKLPIENLRANDRFMSEFGSTKFDFAIAQSVFTHVSLNHIRLCLDRLGRSMKPGGKFYATFYEQPASTRLDKLKPRGRHMFTERNPFWYYRDDMKWAATSGPWKFRYIGEWGHPNGQMMMEFTRVTDAEFAESKKPRRAPAKPPPQPLTTSARAKKFVRRARRSLSRRIAPK